MIRFELVDGGVVLADGSLTFCQAGDFDDPESPVAITGGTGAFNDARGQAAVNEDAPLRKGRVLISVDITTQ